jgi:hypothetical protein
VLESLGLMQQQKSDVIMYEEEQKLNTLEREEVVPKYRFASPFYYQEDHENVEFEQKTQNFEPPICYVVE